MTFCSRRVAGFFSAPRFASACLPPSFSSSFTLLLGAPSARRRANVQYTVILASARGCDRLLSTLYADATGQKQITSPDAVRAPSSSSQRESQNAKACVSHAGGRGHGGDRHCQPGDRSNRGPGALAVGNELAEESRYALRQCRGHVSTRA